jgi:hypothetical protein
MSEFIPISSIDESKIVDGVLTNFDSVEGQTPCGYRGFKIRKTVYKRTIEQAAVDQAGFFKMDGGATGWLIHETSVSGSGTLSGATPDVSTKTGTQISYPASAAANSAHAINTDQANTTATHEVTVGQNRLGTGDLVLASILTVSDERAADDKTGMLGAAVVSSSSLALAHGSAFGISMQNARSALHSFRQSDYVSRPCSNVGRVSVVQIAGKHNLHRFSNLASTVTGQADNLDIFGPVSVVTATGLGTDTDNIQFMLTIYSLSAIRTEDGAGSPNRESFDLDELLKMSTTRATFSR